MSSSSSRRISKSVGGERAPNNGPVISLLAVGIERGWRWVEVEVFSFMMENILKTRNRFVATYEGLGRERIQYM